MSSFTRSRKGHPCICCSEEKGRCQMFTDGRVRCRNVDGPESVHLGDEWRWIGYITGGPGGSTVVPIKSKRPTPNKAKTKAKVAATAKETPEATTTADTLEPAADGSPLSGEELAEALAYEQRRHKHFEKVLAAADPLTGDEIQELTSRGLTSEQVQAMQDAGMRHIPAGLQDSSLRGGIGFDDQGRYLGQEGFLIPSFRETPEGRQYLGFQVAVCKTAQTEGHAKYVWFSGGGDLETSRNADYMAVINEDGTKDQAPLFCYSTEGQPVDRAVLTDGALKAFVTGSRFGVAGIGSPGAGFTSQMGQLKSMLARLVGLNAKLTITLAPDAGDPQNQNILCQLVTTAREVQSWGYQVHWMELGQERGKEGGIDVDESIDDPNTTTTASEFLRKSLVSVRRSAERRANQQWEYGFRPYSETDELELPFCHTDPALYEPGRRTDAVAEMLDAGHRIIVDRTGTGGGKSFWWSGLKEAELKQLDVEQVLVLSPRHMEQGEEFNTAYVRGRQPYGAKLTAEGRILTVQGRQGINEHRGEKLFKKGNCVQGKSLLHLQQRNHSNGLASLCTKCPVKEMCEMTPGGYRYDRENAFNSPVVVMHPASLQEQFMVYDALDMPRTGVVLDDVSLALLTETIEIPLGSIRRTVNLFAKEGKKVAATGLMPLVTAMSRGAALNAHDLDKEVLGQLRKAFRADGWAQLQEKEEEAIFGNFDPDPWICSIEYIRKWVQGEGVAYLTAGGNLAIKRYNHRIITALRNAAWVLVLDATASVRVTEAIFKKTPAVIAEETYLKPADLSVQQVMGLGSLGYSRRAQDEFRLKVLLKVMQKRQAFDPATTAVVDTKRHLDMSREFGSIGLTWMSDSRGSNRAYNAGCTSLLMVGSPNTNLADAAGTFQLLFGRSVDILARTNVVHEVLQEAGDQRMVCCGVGSEDRDFGAFYTMLRQMEQIQALGRLRHQRREGEKLDVWVLGDTVCPFMVDLKALPEVIDEDNAIDLLNCTEGQLRSACFQLRTKGGSVSPEAIAAEAGLHPRLVNEWFNQQTETVWWYENAKKDAGQPHLPTRVVPSRKAPRKRYRRVAQKR